MQDVDLARQLARRYVWWQEADQTLDDEVLLLCQLMQLGTPADLQAARRMFGDDAFRAALNNAPPGVLDARSWNFWHLVLMHHAPPAMPARSIA